MHALAHPLRDAAAARLAGADGGGHVLLPDGALFRAPRVVVGLAGQVAHLGHQHGEPAGVVGLPRALFDEAGDAPGFEGQQFLLAGEGAEHPGEGAHPGGGARDGLLEVGGDFEQLLEVAVVRHEEVVVEALAGEDDFDVERDRLRFERDGVEEAELFGERLGVDQLGAQRPLEALPGVGLAEHLVGVDHQVAAVGAVQGAGFDERVVGHQGAHLRDVFDGAEQLLESGVVLEDHRAAGRLGVVDEHVHPVAGEDGVGVLAPRGADGDRLALALRPQGGGVF